MWEMRHNPNVFMIGEDIFRFGGVFGTADGLGAEFGPQRIIDTPISETGFVSMAAGAAMAGMHPIVELAYIDFIGVCYNSIVNFAAKTHYMSGGGFKVPMTMMIGVGAGYCNAAQHSQSMYAVLAHMPGIKVVLASNAYDAKGLMHAALREENFVIYLCHKHMAGIAYLGRPIPGTIRAVPNEPYTIPIGKAAIAREGNDVTLVGLGWTVHQSLEAAAELERDGISAEVVDLRSLVPLDRETVCASVRRTGRLVVADEDYLSYGVSGEIVATVAESGVAFKSPPRRVAFPDIPIPFSRPMERGVLPFANKIAKAARSTLE